MHVRGKALAARRVAIVGDAVHVPIIRHAPAEVIFVYRSRAYPVDARGDGEGSANEGRRRPVPCAGKRPPRPQRSRSQAREDEGGKALTRDGKDSPSPEAADSPSATGLSPTLNLPATWVAPSSFAVA